MNSFTDVQQNTSTVLRSCSSQWFDSYVTVQRCLHNLWLLLIWYFSIFVIFYSVFNGYKKWKLYLVFQIYFRLQETRRNGAYFIYMFYITGSGAPNWMITWSSGLDSSVGTVVDFAFFKIIVWIISSSFFCV